MKPVLRRQTALHIQPDLMLHLIRSRSPFQNVSNKIRRATRVSNPVHSFLQYRCFAPRPTLTQRHITTTTPVHHPTGSPPRKLDIFVPEEAVVTSESISTLLPVPTSTKLVTAHHDLPSYTTSHNARLRSAPDAAARHKLNSSAVHLGTRYEYLIQSHLQSHLGFSLTRIGGRGDGGVDLIGSWTLPLPLSSPPTMSPPTPTFRILLQAKRIAPHRNPMPALMRELDGTIISASSSRWIASAFVMHDLRARKALAHERSTSFPKIGAGAEVGGAPFDAGAPKFPADDLSHLPTLGILVTTRPLTAGIEKAMASSRRCLMYVCLEEIEDEDSVTASGEVSERGLINASTSVKNPSTRLRQIAWNAAASRSGLEGYNVVTKYSNEAGADATKGQAVMMFQGQPLRPP